MADTTDSAAAGGKHVDKNADGTFYEEVEVHGTVPTTVGAPASANVLDGSATGAGQTVITVPAGRTWVGTVSVEATQINPVNHAAVTGNANVTVQGAGATPAAGTVLAQVDLDCPATGATALTGNNAEGCDRNANVTIIAPGGNAVTVQLNITGTITQAVATATGALQ